MILINIRRAAVAAVTLGILSVPCLAQKTFVFPHALERDGRIVAIGWDLSGGQVEFVVGTDTAGAPVVTRQHKPIGALYSLYGNGEIFKMVQAAFEGKPWDSTYTIYRTDQRPVSAGATSVQAGQQISQVRFPACDVNSKDPAGIEVYFNPKEYTVQKSVSWDTKPASTIAKKQKMWSPSNFRITIGDLPCSRVSRAKGIIINSGTGGGGKFSASDFEITIPLEDAGPFREMLRYTIEGTPKTPTMRLEYLDEDGTVLLALTCTVRMSSVDKEDPLDPFDPSDSANKDKPVKVTFGIGGPTPISGNWDGL